MTKITVNASKTYDITIGRGLLEGVQAKAVVSDDNVAPLYGKPFARLPMAVIPHGESSKNMGEFARLLDFFAENGVTRRDTVAALGGGVVGDLTGFAAACYMRGIPFIQIPTTLLAMVDSSVGGKTGLNIPAGKNLAGAFHQPDAVICDVSTLSTLPPEVFADGCAEVIKYGVIADPALFERIKTPIGSRPEDVIARCVEIKRDIVAEDEFEHSVRKLLNFGHTVGHAIEKLSGYRTSHGRAVAAGMAVVTRAAARMGLCGESCARALTEMLELYDLPTGTEYQAGELAAAALSDKKRDGGSITMVLPRKIGECVLREVPLGDVEGIIALGLEGSA